VGKTREEIDEALAKFNRAKGKEPDGSNTKDNSKAKSKDEKNQLGDKRWEKPQSPGAR
jgi:hypothetical protein